MKDCLSISVLPHDSGYPHASLSLMHRLTPAFDHLPLAEAAAHRCVLFRDRQRFIGICDDPLAISAQHRVEARAGDHVDWRLANPEDLTAWLDKQARTPASHLTLVPQIIGAGGTAPSANNETSANAVELAPPRNGRNYSPVVKLVNSILDDALKLGANDIHFEMTYPNLAIRYRIDGVLENIGDTGDRDIAELVTSHLNALAELNTDERRATQDGCFAVRINGRRIDLRLSVMAGTHEEEIARATQHD